MGGAAAKSAKPGNLGHRPQPSDRSSRTAPGCITNVGAAPPPGAPVPSPHPWRADLLPPVQTQGSARAGKPLPNRLNFNLVTADTYCADSFSATPETQPIQAILSPRHDRQTPPQDRHRNPPRALPPPAQHQGKLGHPRLSAAVDEPHERHPEWPTPGLSSRARTDPVPPDAR